MCSSRSWGAIGGVFGVDRGQGFAVRLLALAASLIVLAGAYRAQAQDRVVGFGKTVYDSALNDEAFVGMALGIYNTATGAQAQPFHGGFLCVQGPITRHYPSDTGNAGGVCGGVLVEDFNTYIASGADPALVAGASAWIQAWSRDAGDSFGDSLSDALELVVKP